MDEHEQEDLWRLPVPAQEFIKAVESEEKLSPELLQEIAQILRAHGTDPTTQVSPEYQEVLKLLNRLATYSRNSRNRPKKPGRPDESDRRNELFERIYELRDEGMSRSDATEVAAKEHHFSVDQINGWYASGRYADEMKVARIMWNLLDDLDE